MSCPPKVVNKFFCDSYLISVLFSIFTPNNKSTVHKFKNDEIYNIKYHAFKKFTKN